MSEPRCAECDEVFLDSGRVFQGAHRDALRCVDNLRRQVGVLKAERAMTISELSNVMHIADTLTLAIETLGVSGAHCSKSLTMKGRVS